MTEAPLSMPRAALFDMDRTLLSCDTARLYVRYQRDVGDASARDMLRVSWWLLQYTLGVIDAENVAERALSDFRGKEETWMEATCRDWFRDYVHQHIVDEGRRAVARHREAGDIVAIVTGATRYAAEPLAREIGIDHVVCTTLEVDSGRFTGNVVKPLCYGSGKITLAERLAAELGFSLRDATFYSDSITDLPLLDHVATPVVVNQTRACATPRAAVVGASRPGTRTSWADPHTSAGQEKVPTC